MTGKRGRNNNPRKRNRRNNNAGQLTQSNFRFPMSPVTIPRLGPSITLTRRVTELFDIVCDGINPSVGTFNFSLNDLPNSSEIVNLFQTFSIDEVSVRWNPEYTELTDAALVSNAVNVNFTTAINVIGATIATVDDVNQFSAASSTPINRTHSVRFKPMLLMDGSMPCSCAVTTLSSSLNFWGISYGIPPTGTGMTLRAVAVFKVTCTGPR